MGEAYNIFLVMIVSPFVTCARYALFHAIERRYYTDIGLKEFGAITGLFVPDTTVRDYIDRRKRKLHKMEPLYFRPDDDANYAERFQINLEEVQPYIALYPSPDNVVPVSSCGPMCFDGVFIGACTTTEEDLILAALVLRVGIQENMPLKKGKRHVVFGSLPITKRLRELGIQDIYTQAGFDQSVPGCSFCVGMGADRAAEGETWLSSQNRNFKNRMGKGASCIVGLA